MAKPFRKRPNDYLSLSSVNELINAITRKYGNADFQLLRLSGVRLILHMMCGGSGSGFRSVA